MFPQTYKNSPFKEIIYPCNVLGLSSTQPTRLIRPYFCFNKFVCGFHTNSQLNTFTFRFLSCLVLITSCKINVKYS